MKRLLPRCGTGQFFVVLVTFFSLHLSRCLRVASFSFQKQRSYVFVGRTKPRLSAATDELNEYDDDTGKANYTLQYSHSFRRHIVRNDQQVVESFLWLDEALKNFPDARLLPVKPVEEHAKLEVAGSGLSTKGGYPVDSHPLEAAVNKQRISQVLQSELKWFPSQVEHLFKAWPHLRSYPADELETRIRFLLAPLPEEGVLHKVNYTEDIDWAQQFFLFGRGSGMSLAQASHALQIVPQFVLRLPQNPKDDADNQAALLYQQTPSAVMIMTHDRLDAWLAGTSTSTTMTLAYLHWKGWEWTQCRVLLHAWPCLLQPSLEPGWEIYERGGSVRSQLIPEALHCLQTRLQLRPWHLQAMFKTHSRLTGYNAMKIRENMDFLQEHLEVTSLELRNLLLNMPSLLGASLETMKARTSFWLQDLGLTVSQMKAAALEKPALLQYSVSSNLAPKLAFYHEELGIDQLSLIRMTKSYPDIWAYSLERNLRPSAIAFAEACGNMTLSEYGEVVRKAPEILRCNWKSNLSHKLEFLRNRLRVPPDNLKIMVQTTPRILLQSTKALQHKICIVEDSVESETGRMEGQRAIATNPSLLMNCPQALKDRIQRAACHSEESPFLDSLTRRGQGRTTRRRRTVVLLARDGKSVEKEFECVGKAAKYAGISTSNMYSVLRNERLLKGRSYLYSNSTEDKRVPTKATSENASKSPTDTMKHELKRLFFAESEPTTSRLQIEVSGYAFPPEAGVRGRRRAGGMALHVPGWSMAEWHEMCTNVWNGRKFRLLQDRHTCILGYPYTRPSRPRCSLYACLEAVRAANLWLKRVSTPSAEIEIRSDCNYAIDLLQNMTQVLEWGEPELRENFVFTGDGPLYRANPDILYPVSRALYNLVDTSDNSKPGHPSKVSIRFSSSDADSDVHHRTRAGAKLAAQLMYESVR